MKISKKAMASIAMGLGLSLVVGGCAKNQEEEEENNGSSGGYRSHGVVRGYRRGGSSGKDGSSRGLGASDSNHSKFLGG